MSVLFLAIYKNPRVKPDNDLFRVSLTCIIREIKVKFDNAFISFFQKLQNNDGLYWFFNEYAIMQQEIKGDSSFFMNFYYA